MQRELKQLKALQKKGGLMRLAAESWKSDFETLVSILLSARTRDEVTIPIAEKLFTQYPSPQELARAPLDGVEKIIRPINFYRNKSKNAIKCAQALVSEHQGSVPHDFDKLIELPGVGRKTANVFLNEIGIDNIGIDTHVAYLSKKLGWTKGKNQKEIEEDLKKIFHQRYWREINETLVRFGKAHTSRKKKDALLEEIKKIK